jgi:tRNA(fMet)-specific endonuclease VapC
MAFLLDTNICSAYLKGNHGVGHRFVQHSGGLYASTVSVGELYTWAFRNSAPPSRLQGLLGLLSDVTIINLDHDIARRFGEIRAALLDRGRPTPPMDLLIASTALLYDLTLVTHNTRDFSHIEGLRIEDWLA